MRLHRRGKEKIAMETNAVVAMCPKCSKVDIFASVRGNKRKVKEQKYEIHTCSICGERYLAHTLGYYSILRYHGDDFLERKESILEITPKHCENFIRQVNECEREEELESIIRGMHGEIQPLSNEAYHKQLDQSIFITDDLSLEK